MIHMVQNTSFTSNQIILKIVKFSSDKNINWRRRQPTIMRGVAVFVDRWSPTTHKCYNLYYTVEMFTARDDAKAR